MQVAGGGALEERLVAPRVEIEQAHLGVDEALPSEDREERRAAVGQEVGPEVAGLALGTVRLRQLFGLAPARAHPPQADPLVHAGLNRITPPGPQARPGVFSGRSPDVDRVAAVERDLADLPCLLEPDPVAVGRDERRGGALRARERPALERREVVDQQAWLGRERVGEAPYPSCERLMFWIRPPEPDGTTVKRTAGLSAGTARCPRIATPTMPPTTSSAAPAATLRRARRPGVSRRRSPSAARGPSLSSIRASAMSCSRSLGSLRRQRRSSRRTRGRRARRQRAESGVRLRAPRQDVARRSLPRRAAGP